MKRVLFVIVLIVGCVFTTVSYAQLDCRIGIDPGHGGKKPGAVGLTGLKEKEANLATALALKKYLEAQGADVEITRTTDVHIGIEDRASYLVSKGVDRVVSIHHNSSDPEVNRTMAFVYCDHCTMIATDLASSIVQRLGDSTGLPIGPPAAREEYRCPGTVDWSCDSHGVGQAELPILEIPEKPENGQIPSVLIEVSFITNPSEETRLKNLDYLDANGWAIYAGIADHYGVIPNPRPSSQRSTTFSSSDCAEVVSSNGLNLRPTPGLTDPPILRMPHKSVIPILVHTNNGTPVDGYWWWYVQYGDNKGWSAEGNVGKTETYLQRIREKPYIADDWSVLPTTVAGGDNFVASYPIISPLTTTTDAWLGLSIRKHDNHSLTFSDPSNDKTIVLRAADSIQSRIFTVRSDVPPGSYEVILGLYLGRKDGDSVNWDLTEWRNILTVEHPDPVPPHTYSLSQGLNLISFPFTPMPQRFSDLFSQLGSDLLSYVFFLDDSGVIKYDRTWNLDAEAKKGYFLFLQNPRSITIAGDSVAPGITLRQGINLVGVTEPVVPTENSQVYSDAFFVERGTVKHIPLFQSSLQPGIGYFVFSKADGVVLISATRAAPVALAEQDGLSDVEGSVIGQKVVEEIGLILQHIEAIDGQEGVFFADSSSVLKQNYPNPFNAETWIPYQLQQEADVIIRIYNIKGQLVRTLNLGYQPAGPYLIKDRAAYWNGRDQTGQSIASGIYHYTIQAGDFTATRKMTVAR